MNKNKLIELIDSNGRFNLPTTELEHLADHLISNGIGDITAEKHRADIAEEALDLAYDSEEYKQLKAENESLKKQLEEQRKKVTMMNGLLPKSRCETPIEELDLSIRPYNCLWRAGISTIEQLQQMPEEKLLRLRNLGRKSLSEIKSKLDDFCKEEV